MKKLNFIAALFCMAIVSACDGVKNEYAINGTVPDNNLNGRMVYLTDINDGQIVDSTAVADGKFTFKGIADSAMARNLSIDNFHANLILEKGTITVDMSDPYSAKGTPATEALGAFESKCAQMISSTSEKLHAVDKSLPDSAQEALQEGIIDEMFASLNSMAESIVKEHPNDALGAMVFETWMQNQKEPSVEVFKKAYDMVGANVRNFGPVAHMAEYFDKMTKTAEGQMFVDFTIENGNIDGSSASLSDYVGKGKYVLVDFWASWCKPCRMETPNIAEVYKKYRGDKFDVVSVAVWDKRENTLAAIKEDGNTWPQIVDANTVPTELYGIQGIPHIILFGPDGTIVARDLRGDGLKDKVAEVMK